MKAEMICTPANTLRVFPRRNKATPVDPLAFVGRPGLFIPPADAFHEIHVSVAFTWDLPAARSLALSWATAYTGKIVRVGGPATEYRDGDFAPGMYLRPGYVITSRGCPNHCPHCLIPERFGTITRLPITDGWNVLDDNLLASGHVDAVFEMLARQQHRAVFSGGLDSRLITVRIARQLVRGIRLGCAYLAYDEPIDWHPLVRAVGRIRTEAGWCDGTSRKKLCCYVLVGFGDDTPEKAHARCVNVWKLGVQPFPMFFQPPNDCRRARPASWRDMIGRWMQHKAPLSIEHWSAATMDCHVETYMERAWRALEEDITNG